MFDETVLELTGVDLVREGTRASGGPHRYQNATYQGLAHEPRAGRHDQTRLAGHEQLVTQLARVAADDDSPATVLVTHHVDEIPPCFTHVLMLPTGRVVAQGPLDKMPTSDRLSDCFWLPPNLEQREERWIAWGSEDHRSSAVRGLSVIDN